MRSLRSLDRANREPERAGVVVRVVAARIEAEVPRAAVVRVRDGRPDVAVRTGKVKRSPEAGAGAGEEDAVGGISTPAANNITVRAILRRPSPVALAIEIATLLSRRQAPRTAPLNMRGIVARC